MAAAGRPTSEMLIRLLNDMEALRRALRLYPPDHPSIAPAETRIRKAASALAGGGTVALAFGPDKLFLDKATVALPPTCPARRLIQVVFQLGLAAVRCQFPEACEGLVVFAKTLASLREPPGENERQALLDAAPTLAGVALVPIDLSVVQVAQRDGTADAPSAELRWEEFADRLSRTGLIPGRGTVRGEALRPEFVLELLDEAADAPSAFDMLFRQMAEALRSTSPASHRVRVAEVRTFLGEMVALLGPERRRLAVDCAATQLSREPASGPCEPFAGTELLLDAVELMLLRRLPIPAAVERALERMASGDMDDSGDLPGELIERAAGLVGRLPRHFDVKREEPDRLASFRAAWPAAEWARELAASLADERVRGHLTGVLNETMALWPGTSAAQRAARRLAEEFVAALDLGDLGSARRLAPLVALASADAQRLAIEEGVEAAARAFGSSPRDTHATLAAILFALGERALPDILRALAEEPSRVARMRLLEVVSRYGGKAAPFVEPLLDDPRWFVVRNAVFLLRRLRSPEPGRKLRRLLPGADSRVAQEILKTLVAVEDPEWLPALLQEIENPDPERAKAAIVVGSQVAHPRVVEALVAALRRRAKARLRDPIVPHLIRALGNLHDPSALPALRQVSDLKQWRYPFSVSSLRREAAAAIALLQGSEAEEVAVGLAHDRDPDVAGAVRRALREKQPQGASR
jgi:HEAT repeat protein